MKQNRWISQYGLHMALCAAVVALAFGFNWKVERDRSHIYTVSSDLVILEELTELELRNGKYIFKGWAFEPRNYSKDVKCELILQNTRTGEALWPKMERNPEAQKIGSRYADGGDYSAGCFEGQIWERKVKKNDVYEILLRYTSNLEDGTEEAPPYRVTASTGQFLCQGEILDYNPEAFSEPEIAGSQLADELKGARLFCYFEEGLWVYLNHGAMYYILDSSAFPLEDYPEGYIALKWQSTNLERIPERYREYGLSHEDFYFMDACSEELSFGRYKVSVQKIPSEYASIVLTGFHDGTEWVFQKRKQLRE